MLLLYEKIQMIVCKPWSPVSAVVSLNVKFIFPQPHVVLAVHFRWETVLCIYCT